MTNILLTSEPADNLRSIHHELIQYQILEESVNLRKTIFYNSLGSDKCRSRKRRHSINARRILCFQCLIPFQPHKIRILDIPLCFNSEIRYK